MLSIRRQQRSTGQFALAALHVVQIKGNHCWQSNRLTATE
jgi:hypothetical protein